MERQFDQEIREVENTRRIIKNADRVIRNATVQGSEAHIVAETLSFLKWLDDSAEGNLFTIRADKKAALKAPQEEATTNVQPNVESK